MFTSNVGRAWMPCLLAALAAPFSTCFAADRPADYQWTAYLAPAQTLDIRLIDGNIRVEPADGDLVEVSGWKTGSRPDPATVSIDTVQHDGGLLICVVYPSPNPDRPNRCTVDNANNNVMLHDPDLKVDFTVRIPAGVKFRSSVTNGSVEATLKDNPAFIDVINGRISATTQAALQAHVVNGSVEAALGDAQGSNELRAVNGSVLAKLAPTAGTVVHAQIVFGPITSEFPLTIRRFLIGSAADGVLGGGEGKLQLNAVNGKITLQRAPDPEPAPTPALAAGRVN